MGDRTKFDQARYRSQSKSVLVTLADEPVAIGDNGECSNAHDGLHL